MSNQKHLKCTKTMLTEHGDKLVLILIGQAGSGKGTVAKYIQNTYDIPVIRYSTFLRDILDRLHIEQSRPEISKLSLGLRTIYGQDIFAHTISAELDQNEAPIIILDGARRKEDITDLSTTRTIIPIFIETTTKARYTRITERRENDDDSIKTFEAFEQDEQHDTEVTILPLKEMAQYTISNDSTLEELYKAIAELLQKIKRTYEH